MCYTWSNQVNQKQIKYKTQTTYLISISCQENISRFCLVYLKQ